MANNDFADQNYIDQIRQRLWCGKEYGQAAVMVGAGFSRNASKNFPLWTDLACIFNKELYGKQVSKDALKLAEEYEAAFGRDSLNNLLIKNIPDNEYQPNEIFELLLTLPWADVFTTNYDTLLERAVNRVYQRKYDITYTHNDIPNRIKPRIIKLHGSFPANFPFIITEEDYRTYPKKMAPFVNLVQQSLMENIFCLIGFSGDDPNFLYWSGWVRDNLGEHTPKIYLCGLLDINNSKRQYYTKKNIIPIDLSPLFPSSKYSEDSRYYLANKWFLLNLFNGAPPNPLHWPINSKTITKKWSIENNLPKIPEREYDIVNENPIPGMANEKINDELYNVMISWRKNRENYPGWIIMPREKREIIWGNTRYWTNQVFENLSKLDPPNDLLITYEIIWRFEKVFFPLITNWIEKIELRLKSYNPFPELLDYTVDNKPEGINLKQFQDKWVAIIFSIIRTSREDQNNERFNYWMGLIEKIKDLNPEWNIRWFYEKIMNSIYNLNYDQVRDYLKSWPKNYNEPYWEIKKASILAEIGELSESENISESALIKIRGNVKSFDNNFYWVSLESWTMLLISLIKDNKYFSSSDFVQEFQDRWEKLSSYKCNPWNEIEYLAIKVIAPIEQSPMGKHTEKTFDPDIITISHSYNSSHDINNYINEFALLRLFEDAALPFKCGMVTIYNKEIKEAAIKIYPFSKFLSIISLIRSQSKEGIDKIFTRILIAQIASSDIKILWDMLYGSIQKQLKHFTSIHNMKDMREEINFVRNSIMLSCEIISRICFRLENTEFLNVLDLTIFLYKTYPDDFYEQINNLFKRCIYTTNSENLQVLLLKLIPLPIPLVNSFSIDKFAIIREPFEFFDLNENYPTIDLILSDQTVVDIEELFTIAQKYTDIARERAILRLLKLYQLNILDKTMIDKFGTILWAKKDGKTKLPMNTNFYNASFLNLPHPTGIEPVTLVKDYLINNDFKPLFNVTTNINGKISRSFNINEVDHYAYNLFSASRPILDDGRNYLEWDENELKIIVQKIMEYWHKWEDDIKISVNNDPVFNDKDYVMNRLVQILKIIGYVIIPAIGNSNDEVFDTLFEILKSFEKEDISLTLILPFYLIKKPEMGNDVSTILRKDMNSMSRNKIRDAIFGLYNWLTLYVKKMVKEPPKDLLNELINRIVIRRQPGLDIALGETTLIFEMIPTVINKNLLDDLLVGLEYLLNETRYEQDEQLLTPTSSSFFSLEDIPRYRSLCSKMAKRIYDYLVSQSEPIPDIINKWRVEAMNDRLPEVKKVWLN